MANKNKTLFLTQFGVLLALEALFCFTPLGALPAIGPIVATLGAIPIVITALLLGAIVNAVAASAICKPMKIILSRMG